MARKTQDQLEAEAMQQGERARIALDYFEKKLTREAEAIKAGFMTAKVEELPSYQAKLKIIDDFIRVAKKDVRDGENALKRIRARQKQSQ